MQKLFEFFHFYRMPFEYVLSLLNYYGKKGLGRNMVGTYGEWVHVLYKSVIKGKGRVEKLNANFLKVHFQEGVNLLVRSFPSSDANVLLQVWGEKEYKVVVAKLLTKNPKENPIRIIDAGANVGYTTVFFKKYFPNAKIICIEPASSNFFVLQENIKNNKLNSVFPKQAALWHKTARLQIEQALDAGNEWNFSVKEISDGGIQSVQIDEILEKEEWENVDLFKMDIEGAEQFLFKEGVTASWLDKVKMLAIEIHPIGSLKKDICSILVDKGFNYFDNGELTIAYRKHDAK